MINLLVLILALGAHAFDCHYDFTVWNAQSRNSFGPINVKKWKKNLSREEIGPKGCTLCEEDQRKITLSNGVTFSACNKMAEDFRTLLEMALKQNIQIKTVLGYRPSKSKGKADYKGFRTEFSNHAFGVAIDINEEHNGLYNNCISWGPQCQLAKGGHYRPHQDPFSISPDSSMIKIMNSRNLKWGGLISGQQKDFMHFSPDGY